MVDGTKKPRFLGQALLLLLPVAVLLVIGFNSLRLDKIQARREAAERARIMAEALVSRGAQALCPPAFDPGATGAEGFQFRVDSAGLLVSPRLTAALTPHPLLPAELTEEQAALWRKAQDYESRTNQSLQAAESYQRFLALHPPRDFAANACYSLGLLAAGGNDFAHAAQWFRKVAGDYPDSLAESGMPLQPLAILKLLQIEEGLADANGRALLDSGLSNLVCYPVPLTRVVLRQASQATQSSDIKAMVNRWAQVWNHHERARALYAAAGSLVGRRAFWFEVGEASEGAQSELKSAGAQHWLALPLNESSSEQWFLCRSEESVRSCVRTVIAEEMASQLHMGSEVRVAGKNVFSQVAEAARNDGAVPKIGVEQLATVSWPRSGGAWLEAAIYLTGPSLLYQHQRTRRLWFGALIASCVVAAIVGLWANWSAFQRQQRLNELKSNFVSSVSHELRTPVAAVRLLLEGLESGRISGPLKQKEYLQLMGQECRRLAGLIENILDFSRIEQGRKHLEFAVTDVEALARETVQMIEPYAAARKVSLRLDVAAAAAQGSRAASLDSLAIRQALLNLVDNAIKHAPEGTAVRIGVNWAGAGPGPNGADGQVLISVEDQGPGIPPEEHEKIFDRFYRRGSELHRETQGIGIGLTIVKHIVEAHGGRVLVTSAVGQGSRFTMELPQRQPQPEAPHDH